MTSSALSPISAIGLSSSIGIVCTHPSFSARTSITSTRFHLPDLPDSEHPPRTACVHWARHAQPASCIQNCNGFE
eukprot:5372096-Pleurochrysis_carterae.AAC.2